MEDLPRNPFRHFQLPLPIRLNLYGLFEEAHQRNCETHVRYDYRRIIDRQDSKLFRDDLQHNPYMAVYLLSGSGRTDARYAPALPYFKFS